MLDACGQPLEPPDLFGVRCVRQRDVQGLMDSPPATLPIVNWRTSPLPSQLGTMVVIIERNLEVIVEQLFTWAKKIGGTVYPHRQKLTSRTQTSATPSVHLWSPPAASACPPQT